jgi:hypothetical protein
VDEFEDTLTRISCGQAFAEDGTEEELTVQLGFVSTIRCQDTCAMELLIQDVAKFAALSGILTSGFHKFHISCMNTLYKKFMLESCLQLRVTVHSSHP